MKAYFGLTSLAKQFYIFPVCREKMRLSEQSNFEGKERVFNSGKL